VPTDGQGWASLVRFEIERRRSRAARVESRTLDLEQLEPDVARLAKLASTPGELLTVAWYRSLRGQTADGLAFARRALALEPSCASCWDMLAQLNYQDGVAPTTPSRPSSAPSPSPPRAACRPTC
jgi:hypothetical protein